MTVKKTLGKCFHIEGTENDLKLRYYSRTTRELLSRVPLDWLLRNESMTQITNI